MKFSTSYLLCLLGLATTPLISAQTVSVSYDQRYDVGTTSLTQVACSDGPNGLITKNFTTFGSLPKFPFIGGAPAVAKWNDPDCGSCWQLGYQGNTINGKSIHLYLKVERLIKKWCEQFWPSTLELEDSTLLWKL